MNKQRSLTTLEISNFVPQQKNNSFSLPFRFSLKMALYQSTSPYATLHAKIYKYTFKTLTDTSNDSESTKETTRKSKENSTANLVKWRQSIKCVEKALRLGPSSPSQDFSAKCSQFRRNVYEYATSKLLPSIPC